MLSLSKLARLNFYECFRNDLKQAMVAGYKGEYLDIPAGLDHEPIHTKEHYLRLAT